MRLRRSPIASVAASPDSVAASTAGTLVDMRILLAEDDAGLRSVLERGLREAGYVVDAVANGDAAVEYLRAYEYSVGVLDWRIREPPGSRSLAGLVGGGS